MENRMDVRAKDRPCALVDFANLIDGVDEFIFAPLGSATPGIAMADPANTRGDGGDEGSGPRASAA